MTENIDALPAGISPCDDSTPLQPARGAIKRQRPPYPPDEDIELWLKHNAPSTFQQLADIRYCLYHHCSRADFSVKNVLGDQFDLTGRHSRLRVINDKARRHILWRLRLLGKRKSWIGAIPRTKNPRRKVN